jgi:hypothetical protein
MSTYEIRDAVLSCEHIVTDVPGDWHDGMTGVLCFRHGGEIPRAQIVSTSTRVIDTEDTDTRYERDGWEGVAWWIDGPCVDVTYDPETGEEDENERAGWVRAVMVGDDTRYEVEVSDLRPIADDDYCGSCGQIGCAHG